MKEKDTGSFGIHMKLYQPFIDTITILKDKYGEKFTELNGFSDKQLNYTEFIDNFIDKNTVADASIDGNANVGTKDICSLEREMNKPHSKLLAFNKIFYELDKSFGRSKAVSWLENEWNGHFYLHDAYSSSFVSYCFTGDTKILTDTGIKKLEKLENKDIKVLNKRGGWEDAKVKYFGESPVMKLTLERYGVEKTFFVTPNHRWFVKEHKGAKTTIKETSQLQPGYRIPFNTGNKTWANINPSPFGVAHGFYMGDGDKGKHARANFCGDKIALIPYFTPGTVGGTEKEYTVSGIPNYFKKLPPLTESKPYLYGYLAGYFAADGCVDTRGRCTISSTKKKNLKHIQNILCILGMPVGEIRYQDRVSNLTGESGRVYILTLSEEYLSDKFFIRPTHIERIKEYGRQDRKNRSWIVKSVESTDRIEDVYCAVVKGTESFTLDGNVLTHNCFAYDLKNLVEKGLYFVDHFNAQPPKHLTTYTDFVGEFVSWTSNRTSGACGLPEFLVYSYYFWKKDVENNYYIRSPEYYRDQEFQRIIYKLNQPYLRINQSAFTNFSIFDHPYFEAIFGGKEFPDGTFMIDYEDEIIEYQKAFMNVCSRIRSENMMTFPVLTYSLLRQNGKFVDEEFARWACSHNMKWGDSNFFVSEDITSLSNCCRLVSDVKNLGYFNSIGSTALEVGSVKVNTINLARIAYETNTEDEYLTRLAEITTLCCDTLDVVRSIIKRNIEKGLLPNYTHDIIHLKSQYNTIGIIGIYETLEAFGYTTKDEFGNTYYTDEGIAFAKKILKTLTDVKNEYMSDKDYSINIEEIPGERAAVILKEKDQLLFPDEDYDLPLYGNQWIPLAVKTTLQQRIKLCSILDKACSGGSIMHVSVDKPFNNFDTAWKMLNYIADQGVVYFAFNYQISACKHNHGFYGNVCPECGEPMTTTYQRIVGFLTPTSTYSKERKAELYQRDWMDLNGMSEI